MKDDCICLSFLKKIRIIDRTFLYYKLEGNEGTRRRRFLST